MSDSNPDGRTSFGERLRWLMDTYRQPNGHPWTTTAVATTLTNSGYSVSRQHVWKILQDRTQPSFTLVDALAHVFGVGVDIFSDHSPDPELPAALYRAGELPPEQLAHLARYVEFLESQMDRNNPNE